MKFFLGGFLFALTMILGTSCSNQPPVKESIILGLDPKWQELDLMGKEDNVYAFSDDILMLVTQEHNIQASLLHIQASNLFTELKEKRIDALLGSLEPNRENQQFYDFSDPYLMLGEVLIVRVDQAITSLDDIEGKLIALPQKTMWLLATDSFPLVTATHYTDLSIALDQLVNGKVDGVIAGILPSYTLCENLYRGVLKIATPPLNSKGLRLVARKGEHPELIEAFNKSLKEIRHTGAYELLLKKWNLRQ